MKRVMSSEKRELVKKFQEAVGRSAQRLRILKEINKKESVKDLRTRLSIPQPTISKAITRFSQGYGLITPIKKKNGSLVFDKIPLLKQIGNLDQWVRFNLEETGEAIIPKKIKPNVKPKPGTPFLDMKIENDARKMAEVPYFILYLLENSIRKFIDAVLYKKYGTDWWRKVVTKNEILTKVNDRKKLEGMNKWHVPRGEHELFYTDLEDLTYFFTKERSEFEKHLDVDLWVTRIKKEVKLSRNIIDHHNPLPQREIDRLTRTFEDWKRQLTDVAV